MKKRVTFTLDESVIKQLKETSDETMIPQARIVEQAIKEYLEKMK
ncbi:ribbon-helix-helix domain-containing protein [Enterococcus sp. JM9B]|nr:ribbon-helix-helix domain-containing protein [Enterococcus sp. JM9B]